MKVKELIKALKQCPEDLPILIAIDDQNGEIDNYFVHSVEISEKGESGYEIGGEVRLNTFN